ncbi:GNAT family N-acetyltransferase [Haloechinothrix sp. YIM 98757]|uniref:GNAT family N-acetyltransferase n=1 Tax=Haloechinothrix aidingensis TaxID=2752311 RepID=A0A838A8F4_9PSEU|nr:GNAT family N-acetyltransferase [Haloechinothrix aidingensis]
MVRSERPAGTGGRSASELEIPMGTAGYTVRVAAAAGEVAAAQRLRYRVFAEEMGAELPGAVAGRDVDEFDRYCDHVVVRHDATGQIVGCYRVLPPDGARRAGRLYADEEFDLTSLVGLRPYLVEAGRSCVHPAHRTGTVIGLAWAGVARYMLTLGHRYLAGCASVPLADGGGTAAGVWETARHRHYPPERLRVRPRRPWTGAAPCRSARPAIPPLLHGYLRLGAYVCGPPSYDRRFDVADFFVLLDLQRMNRRYLNHFAGV